MFKVVALGMSGALLCVGGGFGVNHLAQNDVTFTVDGVSQHLTVAAPTVAGVLIAEGVKLGEHDVVTPSPASAVTDGAQIEVRYGREITAIVDGVPNTFWTTALTVDDAIKQLDVRTQNISVSTSRSTTIGRQGLDFAVDSYFNVTVKAGGKTQEIQTTGTVKDALAKAGVTYDANDVVSKELSAELEEGMAIQVVKVDLKTTTKTVKVPYTTKTEKSATLDKGTTEVKVEGKDGAKVETWVIRIEDGVAASQTLQSSKETTKAVQEVKLEGTKATSSSSSASSSSSSSSSSNLTPASGSTCKASYYWQGQMTANGEQFNTNDFTAAHKTLPFGTKVKVTNNANGKTTVVRINDRGPYVSGRCLDLSRAAMQAIGGTSAGVVTVTYQIV